MYYYMQFVSSICGLCLIRFPCYFCVKREGFVQVGGQSTRYATLLTYIYIYDILTSIRYGYRFGHQSGLDESSGRHSTIFLHGIALRVCFVFSSIGNNTKYLRMLPKLINSRKACLSPNKEPAASPETP